MTKTAANPKVRAGTGSTPAKTVGARGANSVPPAAPSRKAPPGRPAGKPAGAASHGPVGQGAGSPAPQSKRPHVTPLTPMRVQAAKSMSRLADHMKESGPDVPAHTHVRDAVRMLRAGNEAAAGRHLRAAMFALTPQSLMRNGIHIDDQHLAARDAMHGIHRHLLLVKDIEDAAAKNEAAIARDSYGDGAPSMQPANPGAGFGPGALAQKPTARQPPGNQALNAPNRADGGGPDPNVAGPDGAQPKSSKQFGYGWDDIGAVIDMVGPKGYSHGWVYHGGPGLPRPKPQGLRAPGRMDPKSVIAVGGGRKNWESEASQMPDALARKNFPDIARRMRQITPERLQQARDDENRISNGLAPVHPELAQIWPGIYGNAKGVTAALPLPKPPRVRHDPRSVTGLSDSRVSYLKAALRQQYPATFNAFSISSGPAVELSAETGRLASAPAPRGKPGGPGLYRQKGNMHSPYMQNLVKALIEKRGMDPGKAYAIAWGAMRKWSKGGGKTHPEVKAAAAGGLGMEKTAEARAHAHANERTAEMTAARTWGEVGALIDLAAVVRVPAGSAGGGEFGAGGGGAAPAQAPGGAKAKQKAALLATAKNDRAKAAGLIAQRKVLMAALASASGKVKKAQAGATTKATASKTATTAPPVTSAAGIAKATATAKAAAAPKKPSKKAQLTAQVATLGAQISQLLTAAKNATAQAAKL